MILASASDPFAPAVTGLIAIVAPAGGMVVAGGSPLDANWPSQEAILARMEPAVAAEGDGSPRPLVRAPHGLELASQPCLDRRPLPDDQAAAITKAFEAAAAATERA
jgi:hypothetical protein